MNDAVPGETLIEKRERQFAEDAEPWNRYSVANFQTLMAQHPETVEEQQQQRPPMPKSHSVFGPDKIMQSELAKLESASVIQTPKEVLADVLGRQRS